MSKHLKTLLKRFQKTRHSLVVMSYNSGRRHSLQFVPGAGIMGALIQLSPLLPMVPQEWTFSDKIDRHNAVWCDRWVNWLVVLFTVHDWIEYVFFLCWWSHFTTFGIDGSPLSLIHVFNCFAGLPEFTLRCNLAARNSTAFSLKETTCKILQVV